MTKAVMVRCYPLCLLTLVLCCVCGLVWADNPKASDGLIKPSTVGVPSLVRRAIPADDSAGLEFVPEEEDEEGGGEDADSLSLGAKAKGSQSSTEEVHGANSLTSSDKEMTEPVAETEISDGSIRDNERKNVISQPQSLQTERAVHVQNEENAQDPRLGESSGQSLNAEDGLAKVDSIMPSTTPALVSQAQEEHRRDD
ncbi:uncharacterized protein TM35_000901080, partial [Trypanosoma theileri]